MADVAVHLHLQPGRSGAVRAAIAEEVEVLGLSLVRAFREVVAVSSGRTRDSIHVEAPQVIAGLWRLRLRGRYTIRFLQTGAKAHEIKPRHAAKSGPPELRMTVGGGFVFAALVQHPGIHRTHLVEKALAVAIPTAAVRLRKTMGDAVASELRSAV